MSTGPSWIGPRLFLGSVVIGKVVRAGDGATWHAFCYLPGGRDVLPAGRSEPEARESVVKTANSRIKAMFGAGMKTTTSAVQDGRALRVTARAIWRAGVWGCDRAVNAHAMFGDLGRALGMPPEDAPGPNPQSAGAWARSDTPPKPEKLPSAGAEIQMIE